MVMNKLDILKRNNPCKQGTCKVVPLHTMKAYGGEWRCGDIAIHASPV